MSCWIPAEDVKICLQSEEDKLGSGAYGTVYRGQWEDMSVAVKVFKISSKHFNKRAKEMFMNEVQVMWALRHPNIVTIYGANHEAKSPGPFIVMELLHKSLADTLHSPPHNLNKPADLNWSTRLSILSQVCMYYIRPYILYTSLSLSLSLALPFVAI